jgi:hypothetical protein
LRPCTRARGLCLLALVGLTLQHGVVYREPAGELH